jgi:hypothetical protein
MFVGHYAVGFASKRFAPRTSLGLLMAAPVFLDLLWPALLVAGVEHARVDPSRSPFLRLVLYDYPWSHGLLMSLAWSALFYGGYWLATRDRRAAAVLAAGVLSHWVLDFVTHSPDMPLYPGGPVVGLGLWNSTAGTLAVESVMLAGGLGLYLAATRARDRIGSIALWAFVGLLLASYFSSVLAPPPEDPAMLGTMGVGTVLFLLWAHWFDRHRHPTASGEPGSTGSEQAPPI